MANEENKQVEEIVNDGTYNDTLKNNGGNPSDALNTIDEDIIVMEKHYDGTECEVLFRPDPGARAGKDFGGRESFKKKTNPKTYIANNMLIEQDVAIPLRDGSIIYADIFRPVNADEKVPVILAWGFYGKGDCETASDWNVMGVPSGTISGYAKFESADPSYWTKVGYAVANVDGRGCGLSEGNCIIWGEQDGRDGYDCIEWFAQQHWCNGKVGLFGNSALAMCQWWIAAEQPPHLACIAPWEGTSDVYREFIMEGGIPWPRFTNMVFSKCRSTGYIEDLAHMIEKYPLMNSYWEAKIPDFKKITCPAYVAAGWLHLHLRGTINGFRKIKSAKKWLRVHRDYEWPDTYSWWNIEDLKRFFDRYMKEINNGWEMTPKVRLEVMDAYDYDYQVNRPETSFPLKRTQYKKLYLNAADGSLDWNPVAKESSVSYDGNTGTATFDIEFKEDIELTGYMSLHMNVAAESHDDMDLFITVQKLDENDEMLPLSIIGEPHPGAWGKMRVSHRELDPELSTSYNPVMAHKRELKLQPGEIVPVDIEIYPHSRIWHKGQKLRVEIAGRYIRDENWFTNFPYETDNKGNHIIYTGGQYESWLQIPVVPPKYVAGDYVYR